MARGRETPFRQTKISAKELTSGDQGLAESKLRDALYVDRKRTAGFYTTEERNAVIHPTNVASSGSRQLTIARLDGSTGRPIYCETAMTGPLTRVRQSAG
jgi:hypothetical protein